MSASPSPSSVVPLPSPPQVPIESCPIAASLGTLGRKWTLTILRDIAFYPNPGFALILRQNRGLRQRTLSLRLRQLTSEGFIVKVAPKGGGRRGSYRLTPKGLEVWPILAGLIQFGVRNHSGVVFADGRPRDLEEVYPNDTELMLGPLASFARASGALGARAAAPARGASRRREEPRALGPRGERPRTLP